MSQKGFGKKPNYGYYAALVLGVLALVLLVGVYTYRNGNDDTNQYVNLNSDKQSEQDAAKRSLEDDAKDVNADVSQAKNSDNEGKKVVADADSSDTDTIGKADLAEGMEETTAATTTTESTQDRESSTSENSTSENSTSQPTEDTKDSSGAVTSSTKEAGTAFSDKSTLTWPVKGKLILPYSMDTTVYYKTIDAYKCSNGMVIQSKKGNNVLAACAGTVASIEKEDTYGTVVTVDAGDGYTVKYGQVEDIQVAKGDHITKGQVIAHVAKPTEMFTVEGANVYFALQKDGNYQNPQKYLK